MSGPQKGRRGPRGLAPDERRLWERVASTAAPLARRPAPETVPPDPARAPPLPKTFEQPAIAPPAARRPTPDRPDVRQRAPAFTVRLAEPEVAPVGRPEAGLDRRTAERLRRGGRTPDARVDLHGMPAERAHRACLKFLAESLARGHRVVLVITGKGRRAGPGAEPGVLRGALPGWLRASALGPSIVGIYQAHPRHGGAGAFYVYLKRRR